MKRSAAAQVIRWTSQQPAPLVRVPRRPRRGRLFERGDPRYRSPSWRRLRRKLKEQGFRIICAITTQGSTENPVDNNATGVAGPTNAIDKDAGDLSLAQAGDGLLAWIQYRGAHSTNDHLKSDPTQDGGQKWEHCRQGTTSSDTSIMTGRWAFCRRFTGTWANDPRFARYSLDVAAGTAGITVVIFVIRPSSASKHLVMTRCTADTPAAAATFTAPGFTPLFDSNISFVAFGTQDDNTWSTPSSGWTQWTDPAAQVRNLAGTDNSCAFVTQIQTTAAATGDASLTMGGVGNDAGIWSLINIAEVDLPSAGSPGTGALVDSGFNESASSSSSLTGSLASGPSTAGNTLVAKFHFETTGAANITSVVDDGGNVYIQAHFQFDTSLDQCAFIYWRPNASAATTVTVTLSTGEIFWAVTLTEWNGGWELAGGSGTIWRGQDDGTAETFECPTFTPPVNDCLLIGMAFRTGGGDKTDLQDVDGWTVSTPAATEADMWCYQKQTTATAEDMDIDAAIPNDGDGQTHNTVMLFIVLKPATAATVLPPRNFAALAAVHRAASW